MKPVGILVNPVSGRDVRRLAARARSSTPQDKRNQVARAAIGAAAAGAERILVLKEPFRISTGAVENLRIPARIEVLDLGATIKPEDTPRAAEVMRKAGCGALIVLGGDGTNRAIAQVWEDAPLVPISTGTNNTFPVMVEATAAGAACGLVASGRLDLDEVARPAKLVRLELDGRPSDLALIDIVLLVDDRVGNLLPYEPEKLRTLVLSRAVASGVGVTPIGGLLRACGADDEFGVTVECVGPDDGGRPLLAPLSQGLYRRVYVKSWKRIELGAVISIVGPGVLALDGDREYKLAEGEEARLRVVREGPRVIDVERALRLAGERELFFDLDGWHDALDEL